MERFLSQKPLTIGLKDQKEEDSFVNKYLVQEKTMNVPVENISVLDTRVLYVSDVE